MDYKKKTTEEHRKKFAQFFTPDPIAKLMAEWILSKKPESILEPAFGLGVFSKFILDALPNVKITGYDLDSTVLEEAVSLFENTKLKLICADYLKSDWNESYDAIICNPPYLKSHDYDNKEAVDIAISRLGIKISRLTNLYCLFLLKSIHQLNVGGRMTYLMPSEFLNSNYGAAVKNYLVESGVLKHIAVFSPTINIFDDATTTSCILFLEKSEGGETTFSYIEDMDAVSNGLDAFLQGKAYKTKDLLPNKKWHVYYNNASGADAEYSNLVKFSILAKATRGIATGDNGYFAISRTTKETNALPDSSVRKCVSKASDINAVFFLDDAWSRLAMSGKNCYLFDGTSNSDEYTKKYILKGEEQGVHKKYLTSKRNPWYSLENRLPAPILASVFNRNGIKFVRNEAKAYNLTCFHCIYPLSVDTDLLFAYLITDMNRELLGCNRREYGDGLNKFEPNDINDCLVPDLRLMNGSEVEEVLVLYNQYRNSCITGEKNDELLVKIASAFRTKYKK